MNSSAKRTRQWKATGPLLIGVSALCLLVGVVGLWSVQARIAGAVIAPGTIAVESHRQVVQHPDGGVVDALMVKDGDTVRAGDVVLQFDDTHVRVELAIIEGQLFELLARKARLQAERDGLHVLPVPAELQALADNKIEIQDLIDGQVRLLAARAKTLSENTGQILEQIAQTQNQIDGATSRITALKTQMALISSELTDTQQLFAKGLIPATRVSGLQREEARLLGDIGSARADVGRLRGQIAAFSIQRIALATQRREEAITSLRDIQVQEGELRQRRMAMMDTLSRMELRAPVGGVVYDSRVFALRSVISPAEPIMFIIPQDQRLVVSARVEPSNVDQVYIGQSATLRFAALDQRTTPELSGQVTVLSADVFSDDRTGAPYYRVELVLAEGELTKLDGQSLLPGMPAEAFIKTGDRSPIHYLTKPLADYFMRAFREG